MVAGRYAMNNGGADLRVVPFHTMYNIAYAELTRQVELSMGEEHFKALDKIDAAIRDSEMFDGLPSWIVREQIGAADGELPPMMRPEDVPLPPPGMGVRVQE